MAAQRFVALLRGINVGGHNKIPMAGLRAAFEEAGHRDVRSYIQSGQVVFTTTAPLHELEATLEHLILERFGLAVPVVVVPHPRLRSIVATAPAGFGQMPDRYHSDVIFLKGPLTPETAVEVVRLREGVDQVWPGDGVLYFARLSERRTESLLNRVMSTPTYKLMTIRNWSTTITLLEMLDESVGS